MTDESADNPTPGPGPQRTILSPSSETKPAKQPKRNKDRPEPTTFGGKLWHNWVKPVGSVILIVVVFRSMLLDWNDVPTGSMEPEIQVGDRILVNRLAYALQAPLSGPTIDLPFLGPIAENPLDGIPQINWGDGPARGDIVTFWNPITGVRMVKRIVAVPGDTISMTGGQMTINGTPATYVDVTPTPPRTSKVPQPSGLSVPTPLEDMKETLLGETRVVQHIKPHWLINATVIQKKDGDLQVARNGKISVLGPNRARNDIPLQVFLNNSPGYSVIATINNGAPFIDGQPVSYNQFAELMLQPFTTGKNAEVLKKIGLTINGHELQIAGEAVPVEYFEIELKKQAGALSGTDKNVAQSLETNLGLLKRLMGTSFGPVTMGAHEYYMVGDNRNNSHDSRFFGPVMRSEITGEAFAVAFSFTDNKMFAIPPDPAWERFFKDLE